MGRAFQVVSVAWLLLWLIGGGYAITEISRAWPSLFGPFLPMLLVLWFGLFFGVRYLAAGFNFSPAQEGSEDPQPPVFYELSKIFGVASLGALAGSVTFQKQAADILRTYVSGNGEPAAVREADEAKVAKVAGSSNSRSVGVSEEDFLSVGEESEVEFDARLRRKFDV